MPLNNQGGQSQLQYFRVTVHWEFQPDRSHLLWLFRQVPDDRKALVRHQVQLAVRLAPLPPVRMIGEGEEGAHG